jgi:hypothetical protein
LKRRGAVWWTGLTGCLRIAKKKISNGTPGWSTVGKQVLYSYIEMDPDFLNKDYAAVFEHEVLHTLGMLHEHQRYDRNSYVNVKSRSDLDQSSQWYKTNMDKIAHKNKYRFLWWTWSKTNSTTYDTPYDYNSVMHYRNGYFHGLDNGNFDYWSDYQLNNTRWGSVNCDTWLTPWDIYTVRRLYGLSRTIPGYIPDGR